MFSRFFIQRPIFAAVISILIVIAGLVTLLGLPIAQYPELSPPTIQVSAVYPGASARVLSETVAGPIEEQVNGVEGMIYMSGVCSGSGAYDLTITFEVGTDMDMAAVLVQNRVAIAEARLPDEVKRAGIVTKKKSTNIVMMVALTSPQGTYDDLYLNNYATLRVKDELARLEGVGDVGIFGAGDYSMRLWLDPERMKMRGLTTTEVMAAIREQNVQVAAGQVGQAPAPEGQNFQYAISTQGRLADPEQFENIILRVDGGGRVVRVKDVARVELGSKSYNATSQLNGKPTVALFVYQSPGANALNVAERVKGKMTELSRSFPQDMVHSIPLDTTVFTRESIDGVVQTLFEAVILVFLTIFIFLQDWRATLIPSVAIPVSLVGTFAVMGMFGFSLNTITLFGLVLAIGIVVDDAIVVVENTVRNMEEHHLPVREATIRAMEEVTGPIVATTLVLLAVFVPTAFLGGITGQLYRQFALTIAVSTVFSSLNALTLSPALCAILLRPVTPGRNAVFRAFEWGFGHTRTAYEKIVNVTLRRSALVMILFAVLAGSAYFGFTALPTGFVPQEDQGYAMISVQLPDAASLERTFEVTERINRKLEKLDGVADWISIPGYSLLDGAMSSNGLAAWVMLEPWEVRLKKGLTIDAFLGSVWTSFADVQEARVVAFMPPAIPGLGVSGGFEMRLQDRGGLGLESLQASADELARGANAQSGLSNVYSSFRANVPQLTVTVDRVKAKTLGVALSDIFGTLQACLGSAYVNDFNKFGKTYQVNVQADARFRAEPDDILRLEVRNAQGRMIPLRTLLTVTSAVGPQIVTRYNLYPSASIGGVPGPGVSSGQALELMEQAALATLSPDMGVEWTGISYQEKIAGNPAAIFVLAVLFVYLVLCAQYESWSIPMGVILSVPLALLGTVVAVFAAGQTNNVYTQIGIVLLEGLACKNAILIVEFAKEARESGKGILEAAAESARLRFRPILMTSLAFILGVLPLVTATGAGAAARRSLGVAVFGGMIAATFLAVVFVPVFYRVIQAMSESLRRKDRPMPVLETPGAESVS